MANNDAAERVVKPSPQPQVTGSQEVSFGLYTPETAGDKGLKMLIYGASGSGKTYMAGTFPDPIFVDLEDGMRTLLPLGRKILRFPKDPKQTISSYAQFLSFYKQVKALNPAQAPFKSIVIDSMNELQRLVLANITKQYDANRQYDDQPTMADYGKLARDMQMVVRSFIQLPYHIVFTAICTEREYPDDKVYPMFIGKKTGPDIQRMMDVIGYCHTIQKKGEDVQHVVGYEDCPHYVAKDRTSSLGKILPNTYEAILQQVKETK